MISSVDRFGDRPALVRLAGDGLTYCELGRRSAAAAADLRSRGIAPGDRVALYADNGPDWAVWYLAITSMGATVVPILTDFHPAEVERILDHSEPALVVVGRRLEAVVAERAEPRVTVDTDRLAAVDVNGVADAFAEPVDEDDLAAVIYTSGTTGNPKGVMLTNRNIVSNVLAGYDVAPVLPDDRLLSMLPMAHTYECTVGFLIPILSGAAVTYLNGPPTVSRLLPAFTEVHPTMILTVPLVMEKLYRSKVVPVLKKLPEFLRNFAPVRRLIHRIAGKKLLVAFGGNLRFIGFGGAAVSESTERFMREGGIPYAIGYGLTETAPLLAGASPSIVRFRSTGPAVKGVELRVVESGLAEGEVQARGPNVMIGYYKNPDATAEVFTEDGWFRTGDLGHVDEDGHLYIRGRLKTVIIGPSGENVYPEEIEATIEEEPIVEESLVVARDGRLVARVRLNVDAFAKWVGKTVAEIDGDTLREKGRELLASLQRRVNAKLNRFSRIAEMVLQTEAFERTPSKKIKRFLYTADKQPT